MKVGDLFTRTDIETRPCVHCGTPTVDCDGRAMHFEVAENGAKTAWLECYTVVRGRRKYSGATAEVAA
jgi:hypothetical protein